MRCSGEVRWNVCFHFKTLAACSRKQDFNRKSTKKLPVDSWGKCSAKRWQNWANVFFIRRFSPERILHARKRRSIRTSCLNWTIKDSGRWQYGLEPTSVGQQSSPWACYTQKRRDGVLPRAPAILRVHSSCCDKQHWTNISKLTFEFVGQVLPACQGVAGDHSGRVA